MKKIKLQNYSKPDIGSFRTSDLVYSVALGNGFKKSFASEKQTLAFLSETNRELNAKLYELNFLYSDILRLYRASWLYFETGKDKELNNIEYQCNEKMQTIERGFNLMVDRSGWENGNYHVFNHFHSIIDQIKELCELLCQVFKRRGLTGSLYESEGFVMRADYIATAIIIYPNKIKLAASKLQPVQVQLKKVV